MALLSVSHCKQMIIRLALPIIYFVAFNSFINLYLLLCKFKQGVSRREERGADCWGGQSYINELICSVPPEINWTAPLRKYYCQWLTARYLYRQAIYCQLTGKRSGRGRGQVPYIAGNFCGVKNSLFSPFNAVHVANFLLTKLFKFNEFFNYPLVPM